MKLSIVSTLYKSAPYVNEFCARAERVAREFAGSSYEIILVNDGSPDNSLELALQIAKKNPHIIVIDFSRNFGHHKAMMTGLSHARGEKVFLIDSDLEEEPEWLIPFSQQMAKTGCDVVYGIQEQRQGSFFERVTGQMFYGLFRKITGLNLPSNIVVARLMSKRYVQALTLHNEREIFMAGLWHITGFEQSPQMVRKLNTSETTYTFRHKMAMFVNSITAFSNMPLIAIFYIGLIILSFAGLYSGYLVINRLVFHTILSGWTSVMASVWLLGGLIISFIGIIGIYLSKIFSEVKQRPYSIVRQIYKKELIAESVADNQNVAEELMAD
ncbi:glycosyltransferase family 2 protein [Legionella dresdenensis]|uniref:Glycosyltransferase family 2 protein n=1 Tax=Legionella dresdenensis TaxID=450200 RepID=A0ABV8CD40_9GAMM